MTRQKKSQKVFLFIKSIKTHYKHFGKKGTDFKKIDIDLGKCPFKNNLKSAKQLY